MSTTYQITRHIVLETIKRQPDDILVINAAFVTMLEMTPAQWLQLGVFASQPITVAQALESVSDRPAFEKLIERAIEARILVSGAEDFDFLSTTVKLRFEIESLFRKHCGVRPQDIRIGDGAQREPFVDLIRKGEAFTRYHNRYDYAYYRYYLSELWMGFSIRYISGLLDHMAVFHEEMRNPPSYSIDPELCLDAMHRPEPSWDLEQQPCMPESSARRARAIARRYPAGGRVLVLGDDDLVGLALAPYPGFEIDVVEVDQRLLSILDAAVERRGLSNVNIQRVDLEKGLPESFQNRYDIVVADPPYMADGMDFFLKAARLALRTSNNKSMLFLSTNPKLVQDAPALFRALSANRFMQLKEYNNFNRYLVFKRLFRGRHFKLLKLLDYPLNSTEQLLVCPYYYADFFENVLISPDPRPAR